MCQRCFHICGFSYICWKLFLVLLHLLKMISSFVTVADIFTFVDFVTFVNVTRAKPTRTRQGLFFAEIIPRRTSGGGMLVQGVGRRSSYCTVDGHIMLMLI